MGVSLSIMNSPLLLTIIVVLILFCCSIEVLSVLDREDYDKEGPPLYYGFNTLLIMLLVMHVYWFILILRVIARQITSNSAAPDDGRSGLDSSSFSVFSFC